MVLTVQGGGHELGKGGSEKDDQRANPRAPKVTDGVSTDVPNQAPNNLIELSLFRRPGSRGGEKSAGSDVTRPAPAPRPLLFYINEKGAWLELLKSLKGFEIVDIRSTDALRAKLMGRSPDLVLLESAFKWACPLETIDRLDYLLEVPIVLICDRDHRENADLVKRAFAAGIHDTLATPLARDEVKEALDVLLKLKRHSFQH